MVWMSKTGRFRAKIAFFEFLPVINGCGRKMVEGVVESFWNLHLTKPFPTVYIWLKCFEIRNREASGSKSHFSIFYLLKNVKKQGVAMRQGIEFEFFPEIFFGGSWHGWSTFVIFSLIIWETFVFLNPSIVTCGAKLLIKIKIVTNHDNINYNGQSWWY